MCVLISKKIKISLLEVKLNKEDHIFKTDPYGTKNSVWLIRATDLANFCLTHIRGSKTRINMYVIHIKTNNLFL
jgi:hypothetical protein